MVIGVASVGVTTVASVGAFIGVTIDVLIYASDDFGLLRETGAATGADLKPETPPGVSG